MKFTSFSTFLALFSRLQPITALNPFFSIIFIILAIFLLDWTTGKLRRTLGLATIWPFFGQKWLFFTFFDKVSISQLKNHNFKEKDTSFSSTLRDDKNKLCLLTIYLAYKLKNGHFLVTMAIFDILPTTFPTVHWDEDNFAKFFFSPLLFFMFDHDILAHCASYKFMNEGDFNFFQWEISINRWETPKISENPCLPRNLKFS